jgi:hypothetical protein
MQTHTRFGYLTNEKGQDVESIARRARYKLALCQRGELDAINEARALATGPERNLWLTLARESRQDARRWLRTLREANEALQCNA